MRRLSWGTIALISATLAAGLAAAIVLSIRESCNQPQLTGLDDSDTAPFGLTTREARTAFDEYTRFGGEESIAPDCMPGSTEMYRVEVIAAMDTHPDFALVDLKGSSARASLEVRKFVGDSERWRLVKRRTASEDELALVRERAARLLSSRIPVARERPLDAAEWIVQICRHGRYHFFERYGPTRPSDAPFMDFTDAMMKLRLGEAPEQ